MFVTLARRIFLIPVKLYKKFLSPYFGNDCIYMPTCSTYMVEAVEKHGIFKGFLLGFSRILRCNRHFLGGLDPVPEKFSWEEVKKPWIIFRRTPGFNKRKTN